tara:strand:+ start:12991 stop:13800 length:810 start_codon:yes stop_codon:yes gene_type:complete
MDVTVQGEIQEAVQDLGWAHRGTVRVSSRTDSGVSARMNLIDLQLDSELMQQLDAKMVLRALGDRVSSNLCLWGAVKRNSTIPVRVASSRTYLYRLDMIPGWNPGADPDKLERACELFIGNHDFSAFSRPDQDRTPIRTVDDCRLWRRPDGYVIGLVISAESFLWNQVRKVASCLMRVSNDDVGPTEIQQALSFPETARDFGRAPADALVLWQIDHKDAPESWSSELPSTATIPLSGNTEPRAFQRWRNMALVEIRLMLEFDWTIRITR